MDEVTELSENNAANAADVATLEEPTEETTTAAETTVEEATSADPQAEPTDAPEAEAVAAESAPESTPVSAPTRDADGFSNTLPSVADDDAPRKHVVGGIGYEIIYVIRSGDQKLVEQTGNRVRDLIEKHEGAIDNVRASEVRRFAYPIKKQTEGVYVVVNARFKPEYTNELDRFFKLEEGVLRHMMLKEDN